MTEETTTVEEIAEDTIMEINNLTFNTKKVGPTNFNGLRNADYGEGFRMATIPELAQLVCASLENKSYETTKNVIKALKDHWLTGNTAIYYSPVGMFVEDKPEMKNGIIIEPSVKILEQKLGQHEENRVVFSDDKLIRFAPYFYKKESNFELSGNMGFIALVGGRENAEKIIRASDNSKISPYFWALSNFDSPQTRFAELELDSLESRLHIYANSLGRGNYRSSFSVKE